jgi:DNA-binding winged helix-turn-helix (wHTH) protein
MKVAGGQAPVHRRLLFRILGPLEVEGEYGQLALAGRKQRALLALLLFHSGELVSSDRLVDALWGEDPPATAATSLRNLVAQLRKLLGAGTIVTRPSGYVLAIEPDALDLTRFERLLAQARKAQPREKAILLREALALWRGPPLADLAFERFAQREVHRLEELRMEALEERLEAELALGHGAELVAELETLVQQQPLRERFRSSSCSPCTAAAARPTRSRPIKPRGAPSSKNSAWSRALSCKSFTVRSCARRRRWRPHVRRNPSTGCSRLSRRRLWAAPANPPRTWHSSASTCRGVRGYTGAGWLWRPAPPSRLRSHLWGCCSPPVVMIARVGRQSGA